jgi:4-hydroxy-tetrahydrodipicolinate synthase
VLDATASGVYVIAVTPFHDDGRIDDGSADRMVDFYRGCGVNGLTILGVMGEAPKLTTEEAVAFSRRVIKRCGKLPVIVGVSAPFRWCTLSLQPRRSEPAGDTCWT